MTHWKLGDLVTCEVHHWQRGWESRTGTVVGLNLDGEPVFIEVGSWTLDTEDERIRNVKPQENDDARF